MKWLEGVTQDVRHLARSLARAPGFAAIAILTLTLGIGVTTAVMSIVDHALIHSLPFREPDRLVTLYEVDDRGGGRPPSAPTVADWRRDPAVQQAFEGVTFLRGDAVVLRTGDESERHAVAYVGPDFFTVLGAKPLLGRMLISDDHRIGAPPVAVLAHWFWQRNFGGDRSIVGRTISLDSIPTTVVGVMAPGVRYPDFAGAWQPVEQYRNPEILTRRGVHVDSRTIARLRPGVDSARAVTLMKTVGAQLAAAYPAEQAHWTATMLPLRDEILGGVRPMLLTLAGAALAVLLLACANVANLLLARAASRTREIAVRSALGASRGRIVRQFLTESLMLSLVGGGLGTALASMAVRLARKLPENRLPRAEEMAVDHRVLFVAMLASIITALVCGLWPALRASRPSNGETLRASALGSVGVRGESRTRRALVAVQFALALMLLVGAGLLLQSFRRAAAVDVGFDPRGLISVRLDLPKGAYSKPEEAAALYTRLMDAARAVPGVTDAAFINHAPFHGAAVLTPVEAEGRPANDTSARQVFYRTVSASYLRTMHISLAVGRWFDDADIRSPGGSFVINETMAKQYWPGGAAIGKRITVRRSSQARADVGQPLPGVVVGVIRDVHQFRQDALPVPEIYVPYTLETWPWGSVLIRSRSGARAIPALRDAFGSVDPRLVEKGATGNKRFESYEAVLADALDSRKLSMSLIGAFAVCALVLAAIGMYGVVSYGIVQRTRELGVRKALGATDGMIASLVIRESLVLAALGIVIGCAGAWAGARLIRGLLFDTGVIDPLAYGATIALLVAVALIATYIPARRATRLDPTIAMRGE